MNKCPFGRPKPHHGCPIDDLFELVVNVDGFLTLVAKVNKAVMIQAKVEFLQCFVKSVYGLVFRRVAVPCAPGDECVEIGRASCRERV